MSFVRGPPHLASTIRRLDGIIDNNHPGLSSCLLADRILLPEEREHAEQCRISGDMLTRVSDVQCSAFRPCQLDSKHLGIGEKEHTR
ncbi:hypothetical protein GSI_02673 [Ganoderma sinense ZZ0214-1]|uniref:Uncharacterized protein n=1 Tax=Ganoderma sinense ZZ0214-1 TaxID=1077348 RepID=A0A2G8SM91_9APHY|nr:hypothetical protein GSI_02673 [Ganoderma sinense ZZ0214-1]